MCIRDRLSFGRGGQPGRQALTENDLVFVTNGSCTENSSLGDDDHAPVLNTAPGGCWELWRSLAKQDPAFGRPDKFCTDVAHTYWESATVTTLDAVSYTHLDLQIFEEDLDVRNRVHCLFMRGLGLLGKGEEEKAAHCFDEAQRLDPNHGGVRVHRVLLRERG